jgi:membrane protein DedA with SNARE-associated domain
MPVATFLSYSAVGTALWTGFLAVLGYGLGSRYERVAEWVDPVSIAVIAVIAAIYVWRVATFRPSA